MSQAVLSFRSNAILSNAVIINCMEQEIMPHYSINSPLTANQLHMLDTILADAKLQFTGYIASGNAVPEDATVEELRACLIAFLNGWAFSWDPIA